jgi:Phage integrase family
MHPFRLGCGFDRHWLQGPEQRDPFGTAGRLFFWNAGRFKSRLPPSAIHPLRLLRPPGAIAPSTRPTQGDELRALRRLHREISSSPFVFVSDRGSPFTTAGLARMIERAAAGAGLELKAHPHMLRHACGYALANKGHDTRAIQGWLGHRSITSTAVYTALAPNRLDSKRSPKLHRRTGNTRHTSACRNTRRGAMPKFMHADAAGSR